MGRVSRFKFLLTGHLCSAVRELQWLSELDAYSLAWRTQVRSLRKAEKGPLFVDFLVSVPLVSDAEWRA